MRQEDRNKYFGKRVKYLRLQFKLSQVDLAKMLNIASSQPGSTISAWERGQREPSFNQLCDLANVFGVTTDFLLGRDDSSSQFKKNINYLIVRADNNFTPEEKERLLSVVKAFVESTPK